jgi:hypothetical protein
LTAIHAVRTDLTSTDLEIGEVLNGSDGLIVSINCKSDYRRKHG